MATVTFKGQSVNLSGELPLVKDKAPEARIVLKDLSEKKLSDYGNQIKVLIIVPSLDTGICALETKTFNTKLGEMEGVQGIIVSKDLPFAMKRFCEAEGINNVDTASDFRHDDFGTLYGLKMVDGPMTGILARAVIVLDGQNIVHYTEVVPEITSEPDYDTVMDAIKELQ
jgi:thiol peroxidase